MTCNVVTTIPKVIAMFPSTMNIVVVASGFKDCQIVEILA